MTDFEIYSLILCIVVLVMLTVVFTYMIVIFAKQSIKHVKAGLDDKDITNKDKTTNKIIATTGANSYTKSIKNTPMNKAKTNSY